MGGGTRLLRRPLPVLGLFVAATALLFWHAWAAPRTTWVGGTTDPQLTMWFLRWTPWAITHGQNPLLTDHLNAPVGANLMWNVSTPLAGLVLAPVTLLLGPVVAYNVFITGAVALSGFTCWLLLRRLVDGTAASLAGAALYGFSPYLLTQALLHAHACTAFIPPLLLIALDAAVLRPTANRMRAGAALGVLAAIQLLLAEELLAVEAIGALVMVATLALPAPRAVLAGAARAAMAPLALGGAVFLALTAGPLAVQFLGPNRIEGRVQPQGVFVVDLANVVVPTEVEEVAPQAALDLTGRFGGGVPEATGYLGIPLLIACVWTVTARRSSPHVRAAAVTGAVALVLSFGPGLQVGGHDTGIPLPWRAIEQLPLLGNLLPSRLALVTDLAAAVLVAELVASVATTARAGRMALALQGLLLLSLFPSTPFISASQPVPAFFSDGGALSRIPDGSVALVLPTPGTSDTDALLWQAQAGMRYRMPEGYIYIPPVPGQQRTNQVDSTTQRLVDSVLGGATPGSADLQAVRDELRRWEVRTVVVGPGAGSERLRSLMRSVLGRDPEVAGGIDAWFDVVI